MLKTHKRITALLLSLLLFIPGTAITSFADYTVGNGTVQQSGDGWKLYSDGLLYVEKECKVTFSSENDFGLITKMYLGSEVKDIDNITYYYDAERGDGELTSDNGFDNLESIEVSADNPNYTSADGVLYNKEVTKIEWYPDNKPDETYEIPNGVEKIFIPQFALNANIKNLIIPDSVINIKTYDSDYYDTYFLALLRNSSKLENVIVSENNPKYSSVDGVLFNKEKTGLLYYPYNHNAPTYTVPDGVLQISEYAFCDTGITDTVVISSSVKYIEEEAFVYNYNIKTVIFEDGERTLDIAQKAFYECRKLSDIRLNGSRVYSIHSQAFFDAPFMKNNIDDDGVVYLNDILLSADNSKIPIDYTIKDGTTTIADYSFIVRSDDGEYIDFFEISSDTKEKSYTAVNATIPQSVDNIGTYSIFNIKKIPDNMFRVGSNFFYEEIFSYHDSTKASDIEYVNGFRTIGDELNKFYDVVGEYTNYFKTNDIDKINKAFENGYDWISYDVDNVILSSQMASSANEKSIISNLYKVKDGTVAFADLDPNSIVGPSLYASRLFLAGVILPESFSHLSRDTFIRFSGYGIVDIVDKPDPNDKAWAEYKYLFDKCVTFLNSDCDIYDDERTIPAVYTICGYKGSTAEAYALKYGRKFVDISDCTHGKTCPRFTIEPTCAAEGYSGDEYCLYCGEFIKKGGAIPATGEHEFGTPECVKSPTCTQSGEEKITCKKCGYSETKATEPLGHDFVLTISHFDGNCTEDGYVIKLCPICNTTQKEITSIATGHADEDNDGYCDKCGEKLKTDCSCICHKENSFSKFFYKLIRILWRIFGTNKTCKCGVNHY